MILLNLILRIIIFQYHHIIIFCDNEKDANECAELVVKGIKQATAGSLWSYEQENETLPNVGQLYIITNWKEQAKAIIEITKIEQVAFKKLLPNLLPLKEKATNR